MPRRAVVAPSHIGKITLRRARLTICPQRVLAYDRTVVCALDGDRLHCTKIPKGRPPVIAQAYIYDADFHVAEIYDTIETDTEDLAFIRSLIPSGTSLRVSEPFCGTGRLAIPMAADGHHVTGLDSSRWMLRSAKAKVRSMPAEVRRRIRFVRTDILRRAWPVRNDFIVLGGNCLYELATPDDQVTCIRKACQALVPGGDLYIDNDHMEGQLSDSWKDKTVTPCFPSGRCRDGTVLESTWQTIWYDERARLARFRRVTRVIRPDGSTQTVECIQQKHPPSTAEIRGWLVDSGFRIERHFGDYSGSVYDGTSPRTIFWAAKR